MTAEPLAQPFIVQCACKHIWAPFFTPLPLGFSAELMKNATCPKCGGRSASHRVLDHVPTTQENINVSR